MLIDVIVEVADLEEVGLAVNDESNLVPIDEIPQGTWLNVEFLCGIGEGQDGFNSHGLNQLHNLGGELGESFSVNHLQPHIVQVRTHS